MKGGGQKVWHQILLYLIKYLLPKEEGDIYLLDGFLNGWVGVI